MRVLKRIGERLKKIGYLIRATSWAAVLGVIEMVQSERGRRLPGRRRSLGWDHERRLPGPPGPGQPEPTSSRASTGADRRTAATRRVAGASVSGKTRSTTGRIWPEAIMAHPFEDGTAIALHHDVGETAASLDRAVQGVDAVLSAFGPRSLKKDDLA